MAKKAMFITGATGYIAGSFLWLMVQRGYLERFEIRALVRKPADAAKLKQLGIEPVAGTLDDLVLLEDEASKSDVIFNTANYDHQESARALEAGASLRRRNTGNRPVLIHTSGAGVLSEWSAGNGIPPERDAAEFVWDEADADSHAAIPSHAPHRLVDEEIFRGSASGDVSTYLVVPPTVFGRGVGPLAETRESIQIPRLVYYTLMWRKAMYVGEGANVWPNVHVSDLAELYLVLLDAAMDGTAPEGKAGLFYPASEHFLWRDVSQRIAEVLHRRGLLPQASAATGLQPGWFWGSNVRVKPTNSHALGWRPQKGGTEEMLDSIDHDLDLVLHAIANQRR